MAKDFNNRFDQNNRNGQYNKNGQYGRNDQNRQGKKDQGYQEAPDMGAYFELLNIRGYYKDAEKKKLDPDFLVKYAKDMALVFEIDGGKDCNKRSQVRKYYDYLTLISQKLRKCQMDYSFIVADVMELKPKVNYAKSRKVVSPKYVEFTEKNIDAIKDAKDFKAFLKHFEAIIGYMKKDV